MQKRRLSRGKRALVLGFVLSALFALIGVAPFMLSIPAPDFIGSLWAAFLFPVTAIQKFVHFEISLPSSPNPKVVVAPLLVVSFALWWFVFSATSFALARLRGEN